MGCILSRFKHGGEIKNRDGRIPGSVGGADADPVLMVVSTEEDWTTVRGRLLELLTARGRS